MGVRGPDPRDPRVIAALMGKRMQPQGAPQAAGLYGLPTDRYTLDQRVENVTGMQAGIDRPNVLPLPDRLPTGERDWGNWTAPKWVHEAVKAALLPGHAAQGGDYTVGDAFNMATTLEMGGIAAHAPQRAAQRMAGETPRADIGIFAGTGAKTADKAALATAQKMAAKGASRDEIWNKTGWFKGADDKWRFEIDDSSFKFKDSPIRPIDDGYNLFGRAENTMSHQLLKDAYGDLPYDADIGIDATGRGGSAQKPTYWRTDIPDRGISAGDVQDRGRIQARGLNRSETESTALHELQHVVQDIEDFSTGSNVSHEAAEIATKRDKEMWASVMSRLTPEQKTDVERYNVLKSKYKEASTIPGDVVIEVNDLKKRLRSVEPMFDELRKLRRGGAGGALEHGAIERSEAFDQYKRVAGEVEARNVEVRRKMTPAQRRAAPPWQTQEVPTKEQIVRYLRDKIN